MQRAPGIPCSLFFFRGTTKCRARAIMSREGGVMPSHPRRPGQASHASADPGPIRRGRHCFANGSTVFAQQLTLVGMDPGVRRDDAREKAARSNRLLLLRSSMDCFAEPSSGRHFAPPRWLAMTWNGHATHPLSSPALCAIAHWSGGSSTPPPLGSSTAVSGIPDRPVRATPTAVVRRRTSAGQASWGMTWRISSANLPIKGRRQSGWVPGGQGRA